MFDTLDAISNQLLAGEDDFAEFKEVRMGSGGVISPNAESFAGEMVALANAEGGAVFLGVRDDGTVAGIAPEQLRRVEEWVANVASNNCDPPLRPSVRSVALPDPDGVTRRVLIVHVRRGLFACRTQSGRWYVRAGSTKNHLTREELARLLQERGRNFVFDETPVPTAGSEDLDEGVLREHIGAPSSLSWEQLLLNQKVLSRASNEGLARPTVGGLLCFGANPQEHLPAASVHVACYRGDRRHSDDLVYSDEIGGRVQDQIDNTVAFVDRFMLNPARKDVGRKDYPQYPLGVVMEAVVNALAHRDYSVYGSRVRVFLYSDRLEVISPGGLPNTVTLESLRYDQFTRNQLLFKFLSKMRSRRGGTRFIEARGEGVGRILDEGLRHSERLPLYELHGMELYLTIWARPSPHEVPDEP